jgi:hypothetical protein
MRCFLGGGLLPAFAHCSGQGDHARGNGCGNVRFSHLGFKSQLGQHVILELRVGLHFVSFQVFTIARGRCRTSRTLTRGHQFVGQPFLKRR